MNRPWSKIPISNQNERIVEIPADLLRLEPHPYLVLGAPYGDKENPWMLREGVIDRLLIAQGLLLAKNSSIRLAIFDAWRPIHVQEYMFNHAIKTECFKHGIDFAIDKDNDLYTEIIQKVEHFWAFPSMDPLTPPPHSTGAAVDLTLADSSGALDMGSAIDEIGDEAFPDYYQMHALNNELSSFSSKYHSRRELLKNVMTQAGFIQHPFEWWHYSFGDQMWAWFTKSKKAIYGSCDSSSNCETN